MPRCARACCAIEKKEKENLSSTSKTLTEGPLAKQILLVSLPLMLSNLLQVLFNMSDVAVVGRFAGSTALGAVGSTSILVTLFTGFLIGLSNGINVLVAHFYGARHLGDVEKTVDAGMKRIAVMGFSYCISAFMDYTIAALAAQVETLASHPEGFTLLDRNVEEPMKAAIRAAGADGDSVGGILETAIRGLPAGVGEPYFDSMESPLAHLAFSIPAVKGIEFGTGSWAGLGSSSSSFCASARSAIINAAPKETSARSLMAVQLLPQYGQAYGYVFDTDGNVVTEGEHFGYTIEDAKKK